MPNPWRSLTTQSPLSPPASCITVTSVSNGGTTNPYLSTGHGPQNANVSTFYQLPAFDTAFFNQILDYSSLWYCTSQHV